MIIINLTYSYAYRFAIAGSIILLALFLWFVDKAWAQDYVLPEDNDATYSLPAFMPHKKTGDKVYFDDSALNNSGDAVDAIYETPTPKAPKRPKATPPQQVYEEPVQQYVDPNNSYAPQPYYAPQEYYAPPAQQPYYATQPVQNSDPKPTEPEGLQMEHYYY